MPLVLKFYNGTKCCQLKEEMKIAQKGFEREG